MFNYTYRGITNNGVLIKISISVIFAKVKGYHSRGIFLQFHNTFEILFADDVRI